MDNPRHSVPPNSIFDRERIYREQLLTLDGLLDFKSCISYLKMKNMIKELVGQPTRKWLKTHEVRKMLNISPGTIFTLRVNGTLPFTKIGSIIYYDEEDIKRMLDSRKANKK